MLLSINSLAAIGAIWDLGAARMNIQGNVQVDLRILDSGHQALNLIDFPTDFVEVSLLAGTEKKTVSGSDSDSFSSSSEPKEVLEAMKISLVKVPFENFRKIDLGTLLDCLDHSDRLLWCILPLVYRVCAGFQQKDRSAGDCL